MNMWLQLLGLGSLKCSRLMALGGVLVALIALALGNVSEMMMDRRSGC
jgi:hypothetical protein